MRNITDLIPSGYARQTLTKAYLKDFQNSLCTLHKSLQDKDGTDEEFHKGNISSFLKNHTLNTTNFSHIAHKLKDYESNTYNRIDLAIYYRSTNSKKPHIIIEVKDPHKSQDMMSVNDFRKKSLAQLVHYFYTEEEQGNNEVRYLISTNGMEWFIFEAQEFKKATEFFRNIHKNFSTGMLTSSSTDFFYDRVKQADNSFFQELEKIAYYFNLESYINKDIEIEEDQEKLIDLYKALSPYGILKEAHSTDANSLDKNFYEELLYILGLEEKEHSIKESSTPNTLIKLITKAKLELQHLDEKLRYILLIVNRILFLKLLEASLITMHPEDKSYHFLNKGIIQDFVRLKELFFRVLAKKERENITAEFIKIPYLNSSLFDKQDDEDFLYDISVHDKMNSKDNTEISVLHYLLDFLNSYDFGSYNNIIQEESKPLINSAVLGLVFEKLNGYKEGAHFTPEAITSYMSDTSIRHSLIKLFSRELNKDIKTWEELKEITKEDKSLSDIFNKIRICDPAVGSGHFIVSVLNKLIALKHDLCLLCYADNTKISQQDYVIEVENDELLILDDRNRLFKYQVLNDKINSETQKFQEALFGEKKYLIENCLFGVDINPKSVMICQLRLWIELLKHTYYHVDPQNKPLNLETLPNIDINIKEGNSLIHRYDIRDKINLSPKEINFLNEYHALATAYKEEARGEEKEKYRRNMEILKCNVQKENTEKHIKEIDDQIAISKERMYIVPSLIGSNKKDLKIRKDLEKNVVKLTATKQPLEQYLSDINSNINNLEQNNINKAKFDEDRFAHSMEWRYEFPEALDLETGKFVGFDLIIMNPPYVALQELSQKDNFDRDSFKTYASTGDIYQLFLERAFELIHDRGIVSAIVSNKWMRAGYGASTREWLTKNAHTKEVLDLGAGWFDSATVDTNIITYEKLTSRPHQNTIPAYTLHNKISSIAQGKIDTIQKEILPTLKGDSWIILTQEESNILDKMKRVGKPLKDWDISISYGIKTGFNEAFIIDGTTKDRLIAEDPKSKEIIKPLLRGRDIKRYSYEFADKWLINTHNGVKSKNIAPIDINKYPAIKKYLDQYSEQIIKRGDQGDTPYNLRNCAYLEDFNKPKLVWGMTAMETRFYYDINEIYIDATCYCMVGNHLLYLLGIINTKIFNYAFKRFFSLVILDGASFAQQRVQFRFDSLNLMPIPVPTLDQESHITTLVQSILTKKEQSLPTEDEEQQIDNLVYTLYGLSAEEVEIVENSLDKKN